MLTQSQYLSFTMRSCSVDYLWQPSATLCFSRLQRSGDSFYFFVIYINSDFDGVGE